MPSSSDSAIPSEDPALRETVVHGTTPAEESTLPLEPLEADPLSGEAAAVEPAPPGTAVEPDSSTDPVTAETAVLPDPSGEAATTKTAILDEDAASGRSSGGAAGADEGPRGHLGPYRLVRELARGGMGVVYLASHADLGREVALKVLHAGAEASEDELIRFLREGRAAARIEHAHAVKIHEIGEERGLRYLAMDYVRGGSLAERIQREGPLEGREVAGMFRPLCGALHEAHTRAILHRDLKPANVLLDESGRALLTDFGLAKDLSQEDELLATRSGQILGTPVYMPPEQAEGRNDLVDARSDVYSLGATLFHALTGQPPFAGEGVLEVLGKVCNEEPPRLSEVQPGIDPELETITLKCLEKEPGLRYPTALALEEDLAAYLEHRPISARPPSTAERLRKWRRRNRRLSNVVGAVVAVACLLLIGTSVAFVDRLRRERSAAQASEAEAKRQAARATREQERAAAEAASARQSLARARAQSQLTRRALEVLLFDARQQARDAGGDVLELLADLEPPDELEEGDPEASRLRFADALGRIGELRERKGNLASAEVALEQAAELVPEAGARRTRLLVRMARVRLARKDREGAVSALADAEAAAIGLAEPVAGLAELKAQFAEIGVKVKLERARTKLLNRLMGALRGEGTDAEATLAAVLDDLESSEALRDLLLEAVAKTKDPKLKQVAEVLKTPGGVALLRAALLKKAKGSALPAAALAREWFGEQLTALAAAGRLEGLKSVRHFLRTERDSPDDRRVMRVEIRVEQRHKGAEVVLAVDTLRLGRDRVLRFQHRLGLDGRLIKSRATDGSEEYFAEVHGPRLVVTTAKGEPLDDDPPWTEATLFQSVALFVFPRVAALSGPPKATLRAPFILDLFGWDDFTGSHFLLKGEEWQSEEGTVKKRRSVDAAGFERWWVLRSRVTYQQITPEERERLVSSVVVIPSDDDRLQALAEAPNARPEYLLAWAKRLRHRMYERADSPTWAAYEAYGAALKRAANAGSAKACFKLFMHEDTGYLGPEESKEDDAKARRARAQAWLELGRERGEPECIHYLACRLDPFANSGKGDAAKAEAYYREAMAKGNSDSRDSLFELFAWQAEQAVKRKAWEEAAALVTQALGLEARNLTNKEKFALLRARIESGQGNFKAAISLLDAQAEAERASFAWSRRTLRASGRELKGDGVSADTYYARAQVWKAIGDVAKHRADLERAATGGKLAKASRERALLREAEGDHAGALEDMDNFLRYRPGNDEERLLRARWRERSGDLSGARKDLSLVCKRKPTVELVFELSLIFVAQGDFEIAKKMLEGLREVAPKPYTLVLAGALGQGSPSLDTLSKEDSWAGELARLVRGDRTLEQALARAAEAATEKLRLEGRCEALGYAGLMAEVAGNTPLALERYEACRATRVEGFVEYGFAGHRLRLLKEQGNPKSDEPNQPSPKSDEPK